MGDFSCTEKDSSICYIIDKEIVDGWCGGFPRIKYSLKKTAGKPLSGFFMPR